MLTTSSLGASHDFREKMSDAPKEEVVNIFYEAQTLVMDELKKGNGKAEPEKRRDEGGAVLSAVWFIVLLLPAALYYLIEEPALFQQAFLSFGFAVPAGLAALLAGAGDGRGPVAGM